MPLEDTKCLCKDSTGEGATVFFLALFSFTWVQLPCEKFYLTWNWKRNSTSVRSTWAMTLQTADSDRAACADGAGKATDPL